MTERFYVVASRGIPVETFPSYDSAEQFVRAHRVAGDTWRIETFEANDGDIPGARRVGTARVWDEQEPDTYGGGETTD